jgi:hypothetical protein
MESSVSGGDAVGFAFAFAKRDVPPSRQAAKPPSRQATSIIDLGERSLLSSSPSHAVLSLRILELLQVPFARIDRRVQDVPAIVMPDSRMFRFRTIPVQFL